MWATALWGLALACLQAAPVRAAVSPNGTPQVDSAYVTVQGGVFLLNAQAVYPVTEDIRTALGDGVTVNFELQAVVQKRRRLWFDANLVDVTLRRELIWHAVSERYVLKDLSLGGQGVYATLEEALDAARAGFGWPVVVEPHMDTAGTKVISGWYVWVLPR